MSIAAPIKTRDYEGGYRRMDDPDVEGSPVHEAFPDLLPQFTTLRATQLAQNATSFLRREHQIIEAMARKDTPQEGNLVSELETIARAKWIQYAKPEFGFRTRPTDAPESAAHTQSDAPEPTEERVGDEVFDPKSTFHQNVLQTIVNLLYGETVIHGDRLPGMPRSIAEEAVVNGIVETIGERIVGLSNEAEAAKPLRTKANEAFQQFAIDWSMNRYTPEAHPRLQTAIAALDDAILKLPPPNGETTEEREANILKGLLGIGVFWLRHGGMALLDQLKKETDDHKANPARAETLDKPLVKAVFGYFTGPFVGGNSVEETLRKEAVGALLDSGIGITVAHEMESTFDPDVAEQNFGHLDHCLDVLGEQKDPEKRWMSLKLSCLALYDQDFEGNGSELPKPRKKEVKDYLRKLLDKATQKDVFVRIDMEYFIHKDVTFEIFKELIEEDYERNGANAKYADHLGVVFQAYLKESLSDAAPMVKWANEFHTKTGKKIHLRPVKGANLDKERIHGPAGYYRTLTHTWYGEERADWADPKNHTPHAICRPEETQEQYIKIMRFFEANRHCLDLKYGTHNPNTIAHIIQTWINNGQVPSDREIQSLFGMYNSLKEALNGIVHQRAYVPFGLLGEFLAYMYRRFRELEKQSSFPEVRYQDGAKMVPEAREVEVVA